MSAIDLSGMSDKELRLTLDAIVQEQALRRRLDASPEKIENAIAEYQKATGRGEGEPWEQPTGALNAYRRGAVVEHDGEEWVSTTPNNVWEPGESGWRLRPLVDPETGEEIPPPYVPPTGAHDAYQQGERVTWGGDIYEAVRDGVVHSPAEYAADWRLIEPEPDPEPEPPEEEEPTDPEEPEPGDGEGDEDDEPTEPEPDEPAPAEWVQPAGGHDAYNTGDRVTFEGSIYVSVMDGNVWSPTDHPAGWERQE